MLLDFAGFVIMFESYLRPQPVKAKYEVNRYCNTKQGQIPSVLYHFQYGLTYCN